MKRPRIITFETYRAVSEWSLMQMKHDDPYCFNYDVFVRRHRLTFELIREPDYVVAARVQELWKRCGNHHHNPALRAAARELGLTLKPSEFGKLSHDQR